VLPSGVILLAMKRYENQVCLKLAGPLRAALEDEAKARGRSLSNLIRAILLEHISGRVVSGVAEIPMERVA
jgi:hypothetical protein